MRMGFLMGGLVGAAAAMYFSRGKRNFNLASIGNMAGMGGMNDMMKSIGLGNRTGKTGDQGTNAGGREEQTGSGHNEMSQVEQIVESDPELKRQVDEILAQNQGEANEHQENTIS